MAAIAGVQTRPLQERERQLLSMPPLAEQLPHVFGNGYQIEGFSGACNGCGRQVAQDHTRGRVDASFNDVLVIEAIAACRDCRMGTLFLFRVNDWRRVELRQLRPATLKGAGR